MHPDQLHVDAGIVRTLVSEQFPEWRDLEIRPLAGAGTVNAIFRIGDRLTARFPLQRAEPLAARDGLEREAAALTEFATVSPIASPTPMALGDPGAGYPMPWSVQTWIDGEVATPVALAGSAAAARDLASLIRSLRSVPTLGRGFRGEGRGGNIGDHDAWVQECLDQTSSYRDVEPLRVMWSRFRALPDGAPHVMTHGDLIPWNLVTNEAQVTGVLDAGWFGPADPSLDLVCAWHLFDRSTRSVLRDELAAGDLEWCRGAAWAFVQAMGLGWYYRTSNPLMAWLGESTLDRLLADDDLALS